MRFHVHRRASDNAWGSVVMKGAAFAAPKLSAPSAPLRETQFFLSAPPRLRVNT